MNPEEQKENNEEVEIKNASTNKNNTQNQDNQFSENNKYKIPPIDLLEVPPKHYIKAIDLTNTSAILQRGLYSFGIDAKIENVSVGPLFTTFEIKLSPGVRYAQIKNMEKDIAYILGTELVNIARIPSKTLVGIEVKNEQTQKVYFKDIVSSEQFQANNSKLLIGVGKDMSGNIKLLDIKKSSHILISGSTGAGKSVFISAVICSIMYKTNPNEVKLLIIDTKNGAETEFYKGVPHLLYPIVSDIEAARNILRWLTFHMQAREKVVNQAHCKNIDEYNNKSEDNKYHNIILIIDKYEELSESEYKDDIEEYIYRLAKDGEKVGIYLIVATAKPQVKVISGRIKSNMPTRIAFQVTSTIDSSLIIDSDDAKNLFGMGDMLLKEKWNNKLVRCQGAFISDDEIGRIVEYIKINNKEVAYSKEIFDFVDAFCNASEEISELEDEENGADPLLEEAIELVIETGQASTSLIQRRFKIGYARAGRIIDQIEERGVISSYQGSKPREVFISKERWEALKSGLGDVVETVTEQKNAADTYNDKDFASTSQNGVIDDIESNIVKEKNKTAEEKSDTVIEEYMAEEIGVFEITLWILFFPIMFIRFVIKSDKLADWAKICIIAMIVIFIIVTFNTMDITS